MAAGERDPSHLFRLTWINIAGIAFVSIIYFADIALKAGEKCYWFDELFTVYLCRLPSFRILWAAVLHGADFNPPFLYLVTRGAQRLFGDGLIATRLPEMVGVWAFGICLLLFVSRRTGIACGFIAGLFPFFTLVQFYSYDARAHGITLGWCGLALLCWQKTENGRAKYLWLTGFGLSLLGALLTHVYAVYLLAPFAVVELYSLLNRDQPNWGVVWAALFASLPVIWLIYLPLFRIYKVNVPTTFQAVSHVTVQHFLEEVIGPAIVVLLLSLLISALDGVRLVQRAYATVLIPKRDIVLAAGFACIPMLGLIGCKISHGPFIDRYFLSSVAGYAILLGFVTSRWQVSPWTARSLAGCMFLLLVADLGTTAYLGVQNRIMLVEPSSGLRLSTNPAKPMELYDSLSVDHSDLDIIILPRLEYLYLFMYSPASVVSRLYFAAPADDFFIPMYERLAKGSQINLKTTTFAPFLATHRSFLVYGYPGTSNADALQTFMTAGYALRSARTDVGGVLYEFGK